MSGELWRWQPDPAEVVEALPITISPAAWAAEQPDRWEAFGGDDPAVVVNADGFAAGSLLWVETTLEALLLRDALLALGFAAVRLWDLADDPHGGHVVITSRPYGVPS